MIAPKSAYARLIALLGHIVNSTGPEHEQAVAAFKRHCEQHSIAYGDLLFTDEEQLRRSQAQFQAAQQQAEAEAQKLKRENTKLRREVREQAKAASAPAEPRPPDEATAFVKAALSVDVANMSASDRRNMGRKLAKESSDARTNRCLSHDLPFGALVDAELQHHKAMKKEAKAQRRNEPVPTAEEHLVAVFGCSKQWCYRCRHAWKVVTGDSWESIFAHFYGNRLPYSDEDGTVHEGWRDPKFTLTITVDVIVRWDSEYAKFPGPDNPPPKRVSTQKKLATMIRKYDALRDACMHSNDPALREVVERLDAEPESKATGPFSHRNRRNRGR